MKHKSVRDIVDRAGGLVELSYELGLTNNGVRHWFERGIPRRYWRMLTSRLDITNEDIERANRRATLSAGKKAS